MESCVWWNSIPAEDTVVPGNNAAEVVFPAGDWGEGDVGYGGNETAVAVADNVARLVCRYDAADGGGGVDDGEGGGGADSIGSGCRRKEENEGERWEDDRGEWIGLHVRIGLVMSSRRLCFIGRERERERFQFVMYCVLR